MPSFCVAAHCESKYVNNSNVSFHKFPFHTDDLLNQWIDFTDRGPLWRPSRWSSICSRHFKASDYRHDVFRKCLKRSAVPSVRLRDLPQPHCDFGSMEPTLYDNGVDDAENRTDTATTNRNCEEDDFDAADGNMSASQHQSAESELDRFETPSVMSTNYCRLCGRNVATYVRSMDDIEVANVLRHCSQLKFASDVRLLRLVCSECWQQLERFKQFCDRIAIVQKDLMRRIGPTAPVTTLHPTPKSPKSTSGILGCADSQPDVSYEMLLAKPAASLVSTESFGLIPKSSTTIISGVSHRTLSNTLTQPNYQLFSQPASAIKMLHIKQEPQQQQQQINLPLAKVKQEFAIDAHHRTHVLNLNQPIPPASAQKYATCSEFLPDNDAFCEFCDVYFIDNLELKKHIISYHNSSATTSIGADVEQNCQSVKACSIGVNAMANNCEIMEIITLENAFINLAEETEIPSQQPLELQVEQTTTGDVGSNVLMHTDDMIPLERVLKVEHFNDYEQREAHAFLIRREHNYCRRSDVMAENDPAPLTVAMTVPIRNVTTTFKQETKTMEGSSISSSTITILPPTMTVTVETSDTVGMSVHPAAVQYVDTVLSSHSNASADHNQSARFYQCEMCTLRCYSLSTLHRHLEFDHPRNVAIDFPPTTAADMIESHTIELLDSNECAVHEITHAGRLVTDATVRDRFGCAFCEKTFRTGRKRMIHRGRAHRVTSSNAFARLPIILHCGMCGKRSVTRVAWNNHRIVCTRATRALNRKHSHVPRMFSNRNRTGVDTKTGARSSDNCFYQNHSKLHRFRRKPSNHIEEPNNTTTITSLVDDAKPDAANNAKRRSFVCTKCDKHFSRPENLRQHSTTHSMERKHACGMCEKVFKRAAGLKQHVQGFHLKIRPHTCLVCGYAYALKGDMKRCRHSTMKTKSA